MGLNYTDLYSSTYQSSVLRENLYKENTSVLSYYIIKCVLMNNYQGFLSWCKNNNFSLLQFKKTYANQLEYCKFIEKNYKKKNMLDAIKETKSFLHSINKKNSKNNSNNSKNDKDNDKTEYILSNLRMSICELD